MSKKIYLTEKPSKELQDVLINEMYNIEYIEQETDSNVSRMGRKRMVNIPSKDNTFTPGCGVRLLKMDGTGPRGQKGRCIRKNQNI